MGPFRPVSHAVTIVLVCSLAAGAAPAAAQGVGEPQTRAEQLRQQREEKSRRVEPYEQNKLEWAMHLGEERIVPLLRRDGIYARLGSLTTGSGFAYGAGFRDRALVRGRGFVDVWAAGSLKKYWTLEARGGYPLARGDRVMLQGHVRTFSYPAEEFFGLGPASRRADQVAYDLDGVVAGAQIGVQAAKPLSIGAAIEHTRPTVGRGGSDTLRSIEQVFDSDTAPGLLREHEFTRVLGHLTYDYRQPLNARRGGYYRLDVSRYDDRRGESQTFTRTDLDLRQYVSFLAERRVLAGRIRVSTTDADEPERIPFFLLPSLGGNDTLRGFRAHRFRGAHAILLQGEYRFEIWSALEAALFVDAGKVTDRRRDLNFRDLERDYGFGFRINTDNGVLARVDAAFGSRDGKHLHVVFGGIF
jgi:outer membrane protein assembly factor BamA